MFYSLLFQRIRKDFFFIISEGIVCPATASEVECAPSPSECACTGKCSKVCKRGCQCTDQTQYYDGIECVACPVCVTDLFYFSGVFES